MATQFISGVYVPEKINEYNAYLSGTKLIGITATLPLPDLNMLTSKVSGVGINGELDSPTIGQFESMEQEIEFNVLYSSFISLLDPLVSVDLTFRAAQQIYDKRGGYGFSGLRFVERGRVKSFKLGEIKKGEVMGAKITLELTYMLIDVGGISVLEVDKLNAVYKVHGEDMLAGVRALV